MTRPDTGQLNTWHCHLFSQSLLILEQRPPRHLWHLSASDETYSLKKILGSGFPKLWLCNNWVIGQKKAEALVTTSSQFLRACSTTKVIWTYLCHLCVVGLLFNTCGDWDESCISYCRLAFYMSHKHIITLSFCFDGVAVDCRIDAVWKQQLMNITPWFSDLSDKSEWGGLAGGWGLLLTPHLDFCSMWKSGDCAKLWPALDRQL